MYEDNLRTESEGLRTITDYLELRTGNRPIPITDKIQQKLIGDMVVATERGTTSVEAKIEERWTGNLFIEEWANREWGTPGWLHTCKAQVIVFYFRDADQLIGMRLESLKRWLLNQRDGAIDQYKMIPVKKSGKNDTFGRAVPVSDLRAAQLDGWWEAKPLKELKQRDS